MTPLITDDRRLVGARFTGSGVTIPTYDDGFGRLYIHRYSIGVSGIVRAKTWEDAYGICEDEFFPEADETVEELIKQYGFKREHRKVVKDASFTCAHVEDGVELGAGERFERYPEDYPNGTLQPTFVRWQLIETPAPDAWSENELFCEAYGFRPNGPNAKDKLNHAIYAKDLNGDSLDLLTPELAAEMGIEIETEEEQ